MRASAAPNSTALLVLVGLAGLAFWLAPGLQAAAAAEVAKVPKHASEAIALMPPAPLLDGAKLLLAALIGATISMVQRYARRDQPLTRSMSQTYVLLCVAGALTMTMIGESLPRALGVAGAAGIVKFRTPIDDPRDGTALFLLMGLGMACGVGAFGIAIVGTIFFAGCLAIMSRDASGEMPRSMRVAVIADGTACPVSYISQVFLEHSISAEAFEISHGEQTIIRYRAVLNGKRALEEISQRLLDNGAAGIKSVSWEAPKRWM
jgi:hypothetical protein